MRAVVALAKGGPEVLNIQRVPIPELKESEVLVRVRATALNRADLLQRRGHYPVPKGASQILGLECAGEVAESRFGWEAGTRVMALLSGGGYAEYAAVHKDHIMPIPSGFSYEEAAAIPEVWLTAWQLFRTLSNTQPQEKLIIHAGASGVGTALIQLARENDVRTFVTCGSDAKADFCTNLGATRAVNYKTTDWAEEFIKEFHQADVILDPVCSTYMDKNSDCIAQDGRWVIYGLMGGAIGNNINFSKILYKRANLIFTTMRSRTDEYKTSLVRDFSTSCLSHFETGEFKPILDRSFSLEEVSEAHRTMESNLNIGKIILTIS